MSSASEPAQQLRHTSLDEIVDQFEAAWERGEEPGIDTFLVRAGSDRPRVLLELIHVDLERRLKRGQPASVAEYLQRYPELVRDTEEVRDLLAAEQELRNRWLPVTSALQAARTATGGVPGEPERTGEQPRLPGYELLGEIGRGGMGVVYQARQLGLNRLVAVKMIRDGALAGPTELERFRREAEAVARLQNAHIVQIFEVGNCKGRPYYSMEYVEGGSLDRLLAGRPQPPRDAAHFVEVLAAAVHHAHLQGIVHRDLKPGNILLVSGRVVSGEWLDSTNHHSPLTTHQPKITDFGLARDLTGTNLTASSGAILGTPSYMAPEQASGHTHGAGPAADVYALGAILYEMLTGRPPFRGQTPFETLQQLLHSDPVPPVRLQPGCPRDLNTICLKCLHKQPGQRYATAAELADELHRFGDGQPIRARPAPAWEWAAKWARRHPAWAALWLLLLLSVASLVAGGVWHTVQLERYNAGLQEALGEAEQARAAAQDRERMVARHLYASDVRLAHQFSWKRGDVRQMLHLLERHAPASAGTGDERGFGWHYLNALCQAPGAARLHAHAGAVVGLVFHPDGRLLATAGADRVVKLWDTEAQHERAAWPTPDEVQALAFSVDGRWLLRCTSAGLVERWNVGRAQAEAEPVRLAAARPGAAVFSADARVLVTAHPDHTVRAWDVATGRELRRFESWREHRVDCLAVSPDGQILGYGTTAHNTLLRYEVATGRELGTSVSWFGTSTAAWSHHPARFVRADLAGQICPSWGDNVTYPGVLHGHTTRVRGLAFSFDDRLLASGGDDTTVRLWDLRTTTMRLFKGHTAAVACVGFAPDGTRLASGATDGTVLIWPITLIQDHETLHPAFRARGPVAVAPDGKTLGVVCDEGDVYLLDPVTGRDGRRLRLASAARAIAFASDGRNLAAVSDEGVWLCDAVQGTMRSRLTGIDAAVASVGFAPDGLTLALGTTDGRVLLWDVAASRVRGTWAGHQGAVQTLAFSSDGKLLASGCRGGLVKVWDVQAGKERHSWQVGRGGVECVAFTHGRGLLAAASSDGVTLFDLAAGQPLPNLSSDRGGSGPMHHVAFSPDDKLLAVSNRDGAGLFVWDANTRVLRQYFRSLPQEAFTGLTFLPDRRRRCLVTVTRSSRLQCWDLDSLATPAPPGQTLRPVRGLAFSADGRTLLTASGPRLPIAGDPTVLTRVRSYQVVDNWEHGAGEGGDDIRFWDSAAGVEKEFAEGQKTLGALSVAVSPEGRRAVAVTIDGVVTLWDLEARRPRATWFVSEPARAYWQMWQAARHVRAPIFPIFTEFGCSAAISADGEQVAVATGRGAVRVWDADGHGERLLDAGDPHVAEPRPFHSALAPQPGCVAFAPDGQTLATSRAGQVRVWRLDTGTPRQLWTTGSEVCSLLFVADGRLLAVGGEDGAIRLWDVERGAPSEGLNGHTGAVTALTLSPNGRAVASASRDGTVRVWDLTTRRELLELEGHGGIVHTVAFAPDGRLLASGGETPEGEGKVLLWRAR